MPRDKTDSHEKIVKAAMQEFLEKGFEQASMKAVADAVGMTSAALYRHFQDKQDMFAAMVEPALEELNAWKERHTASGYAALEQESPELMWDFENDLNDAHLILDVMYRQPEAFRLLICCSAGTPYETVMHDLSEESTDEMMHFLECCKTHGISVRDIRRDEMHMLVTAYNAALLEPIAHGYDRKDAERYLKTIVEFFTPGWRMITGL